MQSRRAKFCKSNSKPHTYENLIETQEHQYLPKAPNFTVDQVSNSENTHKNELKVDITVSFPNRINTASLMAKPRESNSLDIQN